MKLYGGVLILKLSTRCIHDFYVVKRELDVG